MIQEIQIGDFIHGSYKYGCICGKVKQVKNRIVIIEKYNQYYDTYTPTGISVNVTKSRISEINKNGN